MIVPIFLAGYDPEAAELRKSDPTMVAKARPGRHVKDLDVDDAPYRPRSGTAPRQTWGRMRGRRA